MWKTTFKWQNFFVIITLPGQFDFSLSSKVDFSLLIQFNFYFNFNLDFTPNIA